METAPAVRRRRKEVFARRSRKISAVFPSSDDAGTGAATTPDAPIDCQSSGRVRTAANEANWQQPVWLLASAEPSAPPLKT